MASETKDRQSMLPQQALSPQDIKRKPLPERGSSSGFKEQPSSPTTREPFAPFEVPTKEISPYSGFIYNQQLFDLQVTPDEWTRFGSDLAHALRLTSLEKLAAWTTGISVGFFGAGLGVPGYYAGKAMKERSIARKLNAGEKCGSELEATLRFWNETCFRDKGFRAKLRLPKKRLKDSKDETGPEQSDSKDSDNQEGKKKKKAKKPTRSEKKQAKELEKHYTVIIEDISEPLTSPDIPDESICELEEASPGAYELSTPKPPPYAAELAAPEGTAKVIEAQELPA